MELADRISGVCLFYFFKPWAQLTEAQQQRALELYERVTKLAAVDYEKDLVTARNAIQGRTYARPTTPGC